MTISKLDRAYVPFYLDGREAKLLRADIDTDELAERVLAGKGSIHEVTLAAVADAAKGLLHDRQKRQWLRDNEDEIKEAGGDESAAYDHFCQGKIDELTWRLNEEVVEALGDGGDDDDDDDDDDAESDGDTKDEDEDDE